MEQSTAQKNIPSLYEWMGGPDALHHLTERFYEKVLKDELLRPLFEGMAAAHPHHVGDFRGEVLGGPTAYTASRGGHAHMILRHLGRNISQAQRRQWVALLLETADELKFPDDPEFRAAFVACLEWGSRLAVINSQLPADTSVDESASMPK